MQGRRSAVPAIAAVLVPLLLLVLAVLAWRVLRADPQPRPAPAAGSAAQALAQLPVRPAETGEDYQRTRFGESWVDTDGNGCRTRDDVLRRDLREVRLGEDGCTVLAGTLEDPYSGEVIAFRRGAATSADVQVDHVVALAAAWRTGAADLDEDELVRFANDPLELLAVDGPLNSAKGDDDASQWLPPRGECAYVARQVAVKREWGLWVTPAEHAAMADVLAGCPGEPLPTGDAWTP
ncbi:HNH endonuclease family protein [Kineococcus sp. SYSU DK006]|uniref:HNH endonuclease family protein n=1 Tax=Kineococcus sp. SYSU DK006 TaxID=3383127 RepID=UPI003D7DEAE8